jgi:WD40 repeat protein
MLYLDTEVCSLDVVKDIIVVGCKNGKIKIFGLKTGKCKKEWQAHSDGEFSASYVYVNVGHIGEKEYIVSGADDGVVRVWDFKGELKHAFLTSEWVFAVKTAPNSDGDLDIYCDLSGQKLVMFAWDKEIKTCSNKEELVALIQPDQLVVTSGRLKDVSFMRVLDVKNNKIVTEYIFETEKFFFIRSIVPIANTHYMCIFFDRQIMVIFDWKNKKIMEMLSTTQKENVVAAGGFFFYEGELYTVVGLTNGKVDVKTTTSGKIDEITFLNG